MEEEVRPLLMIPKRRIENLKWKLIQTEMITSQLYLYFLEWDSVLLSVVSFFIIYCRCKVL